MPRSLVMDTDASSDDAVALLMAARIPTAEIRAVTIMAVSQADEARCKQMLTHACTEGGSDEPS